jgi:hypothetical protein
MTRLVWLALAASLLLAACGPQVPAAATVRPVDEIPGGVVGPRVLDNQATAVTIAFETGTPTVCNVAYGTDASYGAIATELMLMGASLDHDVTITGLTPSTTYHYRLNLTDEQANLYQSQDFTFTTASVESQESPAAPGAERQIENVAALAAGARVNGVSSNWAGGDNDSAFGAHKSIDGDPATAWSSAGDGDNAWIEIELPGSYDVESIGFWTRTMSNDTAQIFQFSVTTDRGESLGPFDLPSADVIHAFDVRFTARTLRFDVVRSNGGNTGAVEIEVYGTPHQP